MPWLINGEPLPEEWVKVETDSLRARFRQLSPEQRAEYGFDDATMEQRAREWARENVIERVLLRQVAAADEEPVPEEALEKAVEATVKRFGGKEKIAEAGLDEDELRKEAEVNLKLERLLAGVTSKAKPPRPKEIAEIYRKNAPRFEVSETIRAAHVVKHINEDVTEEQAREAIEQAKAELDAGKSFEEVADSLSDCPGNGGDLGWFGRGKMVAEFERVVFDKLEPGQMSEIFKSPFGFHIAKVHEKKPPSIRPLSEVRDDIAKMIQRDKETKLVEEYVDGLREKAKIEEVPAESPAEATVQA